jgi:uncharacterized membrane protein HdeD (DUF308 family)
MAFGIVAIAGGIIAFMSPQATLATLLGVIAGFAIISGIVLLMGAGKMASFQRSMPNTARV